MRPLRAGSAGLAIALAAIAVPPVARAEVTDEEYAVYEALLQQGDWSLPKWHANYVVERYVIHETTTAEGRGGKDVKGLRGLDPSAASMFDERNQTGDRLDAKRFPDVKVRLLSVREYEAIFVHPADGFVAFDGRAYTKKTDPWSYFEGKYPRSQGLLTVSRVGFDQDGRQALLYFRDIQEAGPGVGRFALFEKTAEGWKLLELSRRVGL